MKAYTVAIGNFNPRMRASVAAIEFIKTLDWLIGVHPEYPRGTILLFHTKNQAKIARNLLELKGIQAGRNICEVEIDDIYAKGV